MEKKNFKCDNCNKVFTVKRNMKRHLLNCKENTKRFLCSCQKAFTRIDNLKKHKRVCKDLTNKQADFQNVSGEQDQRVSATTQGNDNNTDEMMKRRNEEDPFDDSFEQDLTPRFLDYVDNKVTADNWYCSFCKLIVSAKDKLKHFQSSEHKDKAMTKYDGDVYKIGSCFGDKIVVYRIKNTDETKISVQTFLEEKKPDIIKLLNVYTELHSSITFQMEIRTTFIKPDLEGGSIQGIFFINHSYTKLQLSDIVTESDSVKKVEDIFKQLTRNTEEIVMKGSNWTLSKIHHLDLHINKKESLQGGSKIELPASITSKRACINPQNQDDQCFKWCIKAYFLYELLKEEVIEKNNQIKLNTDLSTKVQRFRATNEYHKLRRRLTHISPQDEAMVDATFNVSFDNLEFPTKLEDLGNFVASNPSINLNVFGISAEDEKTIVGPLYSSERDAPHNICLLLLTRASQSHFCWIKDLSRLTARQRKNRREKLFYCQVCLLSFKSEDRLKVHKEAGCLGKLSLRIHLVQIIITHRSLKKLTGFYS